MTTVEEALPLGVSDEEMGPCRLGTCAPSDIWPHGTVGHPLQCPKRPDEGPSATHPGSQSMEGRTSLCSLERHTVSPHACHANDPGSH